jgi:hypothetical protein
LALGEWGLKREGGKKQFTLKNSSYFVTLLISKQTRVEERHLYKQSKKKARA